MLGVPGMCFVETEPEMLPPPQPTCSPSPPRPQQAAAATAPGGPGRRSPRYALTVRTDSPASTPPHRAPRSPLMRSPSATMHSPQPPRTPAPRMPHECTVGHEISDFVQFSSETFYCTEDEKVVAIDVFRLGSVYGTAAVDYFTKDGSARAGCKYIAAHGTIEFLPGEMIKTIYINIIDDDAFDTTLEFMVFLANPVGMELGMYLNTCRVFIADDDSFPTNKFASELQDRRIADIPQWALIVEYFKMTLGDSSLRCKCWKNMVSDQMHNLNYAYTVLLANYLIDEVLRPADGGDPPEMAGRIVWLLVLVSLLPNLILILLDRRNVLRRIQGISIGKLQANLLRKFLYYNETSRNIVSPSDLTMAIARDVPELVEGFMTCFRLVKNLGLLLVLAALFAPQLVRNLWFTCLLLLGFPALMAGFLALRQRGTEKRQRAFFHAQTEVIAFIQHGIECYRLIADYSQRPAIIATFQEKVSACNDARLHSNFWALTNRHIAPVLTTLFAGCFILVSYQGVMDRSFPIGEFITGVAVCRAIGVCYESLYHDMLQVHSALTPMHNIAFYMNMPVDVQQRMYLCRDQLDDGRMELQRQVSACTPEKSEDLRRKGLYHSDLVSIRGRGLSFAYPVFSGGGLEILKEALFEIPQGKLVAVTGPRGGGKATLLQLLAGVLLPSEKIAQSNGIFVPPHLRVLHVSFQPQLINDLDLFGNLCFGFSGAADVDPKRVLTICRRLGMSAEVLEVVEREAGLRSKRSNVPTDSVYPLRQITSSTESSGLTASGSCSDVPLHSPKARVRFRQQRSKSSKSMVHVGSSFSVATRIRAEAGANECVSHTDKCLLHIARALITNPDVLVIHKPLDHFDDLVSWQVLDLLREFVDKRGVENAPEDLKSRRVRTCIFSTLTTSSAEVADMVMHVGHGVVQAVDQKALDQIRLRAREVFASLDLDGDNRVTRDEFLECIRKVPWVAEVLGVMKGQLSGSDAMMEAELGKVFDKLDHNHSGEVELNEMVQYLRGHVDANLPQLLSGIAGRPSEFDSLLRQQGGAHNAGGAAS